MERYSKKFKFYFQNNKKQINLNVDGGILFDEYNYVINVIDDNLKNDRIIMFVLK
jgi:hypothetical protein